jgi:hypothetical protein
MPKTTIKGVQIYYESHALYAATAAMKRARRQMRGGGYRAANRARLQDIECATGRSHRHRRSRPAQPIRRGVLVWAGPDVVDDFAQEIPISRRELDVIETYLGALLDGLVGPEQARRDRY